MCGNYQKKEMPVCTMNMRNRCHYQIIYHQLISNTTIKWIVISRLRSKRPLKVLGYYLDTKYQG